jgi:DNA-binding NtrC family response regulator
VNFSTTPAGKPGSLDVLVIDDEQLIRWSLAEALTQAGHRVSEAGDRATALQVLQTRPVPPDVILLDFRLPDSNDLGLLTAIRQLAPQAGVILMTAYDTPEITRGALELGAFRVVHKPFEVFAVVALVVEAHASRQS